MRGNRLHIFFGQPEDVVGLDAPHHHDRGVGGGISLGEVGFQIVQGPLLNVGRPADHRPVVRVRDDGGCLQLLVEQTEIVVVDAQPALGVHHLPLGFDDLRIEGKVLHAICFQVEDEF